LVISLPVEAVLRRLDLECGSLDRDNRQARMKVVGLMPFPDKRILLASMAEDADPAIRIGAQFEHNAGARPVGRAKPRVTGTGA
jgi:hypothetical protein